MVIEPVGQLGWPSSRGGRSDPDGVDPGLLDDVSWSRTDDLWLGLEALVTYVRAGIPDRAFTLALPILRACGPATT